MTRDGRDDVEQVAAEVDALVQSISQTVAEMTVLLEKYRALRESEPDE